MRLAAIYIDSHDYLFEEPQTINFGGNFFYSFEKIGNAIHVTRKENIKFIPDFFNLTNLQSKVTNLNAIVGQNGAGKSTILDIIRGELIPVREGLPNADCLLIVENEEGAPQILTNDFDRVYLVNSSDIKSDIEELSEYSNKIVQTVFFSPHYDYKFNPSFDEIDDHDLSFDRIVEEDLKDLREMDNDESGWHFSASQELLFKNSIRQITFLSSRVAKNEVFRKLFKLQDHYEPILYFRGYNRATEDWNTPFGLRLILKNIEEKVYSERQDWDKLRDSGATQVQIHQYILKSHIIACIISLLKRQMERNNSFLYEGLFPYDSFRERIESSSAYETLLLFEEHSTINFKNQARNIFKKGVIKNLIDRLYSSIDNSKDENSVTNTTLRTTKEDAVDILNLQRDFLNDLNSYYNIFNKGDSFSTTNSRERIEGFINYMPFDRRMSSGEGALLNLFSRIYYFLQINLKGKTKYRRVADHYILLLDEGDLTFHITWKKKYVKALLLTLPYFFDELSSSPSLEIIITTHDPITLSDLPNSNVIYIERPSYDFSSRILDFDNKQRPLKTFGANISELIADSFFTEGSLVGDFAFDKIQDTIKWLSNDGDLEKKSYYKRLIEIVDEPIVQLKLAEMYDDKNKESFQIAIIEKQISTLQDLKKRIED